MMDTHKPMSSAAMNLWARAGLQSLTTFCQKPLQEPGIGKLHLHPGLKAVKSNEREVLLSNNLRITFESANSSGPDIRLGEYKCAQGYNTLATGVVISYSVVDEINILFRDVT